MAALTTAAEPVERTGPIAIYHPSGTSGARITATLINSLQWHDRQFGAETMCVGDGHGKAMVIERLSLWPPS
jgi:acetyl-CoA C-acetyltransferase